MNPKCALLVGSHFYPPARGLLEVMVAGCPLVLTLEPENLYDPKAIGVYVAPETLQNEQYCAFDRLAEAIGGFTGGDWEMLSQMPLIKLGHVADSDGKVLAKRGETVGNREVGAWLTEGHTPVLSFNHNGEPYVEMV
jgi:hypothetical protein